MRSEANHARRIVCVCDGGDLIAVNKRCDLRAFERHLEVVPRLVRERRVTGGERVGVREQRPLAAVAEFQNKTLRGSSARVGDAAEKRGGARFD